MTISAVSLNGYSIVWRADSTGLINGILVEEKPDLGFSYEAIDTTATPPTKTVGGVTTVLTLANVKNIAAFIQTLSGAIVRATGVNSAGIFMTSAPVADIEKFVETMPPDSSGGWVYDFQTDAWKRRSFVNEAGLYIGFLPTPGVVTSEVPFAPPTGTAGEVWRWNAVSQAWEDSRSTSEVTAFNEAALTAARKNAIARLNTRSKEIRVLVAECDDSLRVAAWAHKATIAQRIKSGTGDAADEAVLASELSIRNSIPGRTQETMAQFVDMILFWANADAAAAAVADGFQKLVEAQIMQATDVASIATLLVVMSAQADQMLAATLSARANL